MVNSIKEGVDGKCLLFIFCLLVIIIYCQYIYIFIYFLESFMVVGDTVDLTTLKLLKDQKLGEITKRKRRESFVDDEFIKFLGHKYGRSAIELIY